MHDISWFFGKTLAQKIGFLNLKKNLVINFHRILFKSKNLYYLLCVYTDLVFGKDLAPEIFTKMLSSDCRVLKLFISLEQIDETASFLACWNKFAKIWTWLKVFWLGMVKNGCDQSAHKTLILALSQKWTDGINWFFCKLVQIQES